MAILEALEEKLKRGDAPLRGFYLAFGHDEEVYGLKGTMGRNVEKAG
jgi:acetylornithine deacetylase/succinyl-diaminopimelate desuccinylase-like protein